MAKGITKSQLMNELGEKWGVSKKEAAEMLDALVQLAYSHAKAEGEMMIPGLGKLVKAHRKARMGRNPATGEQIHIPAKTVAKFRLAKAAKDAIL